jgi:hypothetical protein
LAVLWSSAIASGTTVVPMSLTTLADHSAQVIIGEVSEVRCFWAENPRQILSEVTFSGVQYLKGGAADSGDTFTLVVPGGTVGDLRMQVCCAPSFDVGEKWLVCLLPAYKTFPVAGVSQGAFRIVNGVDGVERVFQEVHEALWPIAGIDAEGFVRVHQRPARAARRYVAGGVNSRVKAEVIRSGAPSAMSCEEFLDRLVPILRNSKNYEMTAPAGRRVPIRYRSVRLQPSPRQRGPAGEAPARPVLRGKRPARWPVAPPAGPSFTREEPRP